MMISDSGLLLRATLYDSDPHTSAPGYPPAKSDSVNCIL